MSTTEERLEDLLRQLDPVSQEALLAFGEFLASRKPSQPGADTDGRPGSSTAPIPEPRPIPRPESEKVVAAIKRLSQSYFMLDKTKMLGYTGDLLTQHVMGGREAAEVIDELEDLFQREYRALKGD